MSIIYRKRASCGSAGNQVFWRERAFVSAGALCVAYCSGRKRKFVLENVLRNRMKDEDIHTMISNLGADSKKPVNSKNEDLQVIQEFLEYREKNRTH